LNAETFYKNVGANLRHLRKQKGFTQEQFGNLFNLTKSAIVNYETGIRKIPVDLLYRIASFHGVTIDSLICKKQTIADVLQSEIGKTTLNESEEDLLITFIKAFKNMKEGNEHGKSNSAKQE
jgi:transcriptional regulator with XRE-family HTH domain